MRSKLARAIARASSSFHKPNSLNEFIGKGGPPSKDSRLNLTFLDGNPYSSRKLAISCRIWLSIGCQSEGRITILLALHASFFSHSQVRISPSAGLSSHTRMATCRSREASAKATTESGCTTTSIRCGLGTPLGILGRVGTVLGFRVDLERVDLAGRGVVGAGFGFGVDAGSGSGGLVWTVKSTGWPSLAWHMP